MDCGNCDKKCSEGRKTDDTSKKEEALVWLLAALAALAGAFGWKMISSVGIQKEETVIESEAAGLMPGGCFLSLMEEAVGAEGGDWFDL